MGLKLEGMPRMDLDVFFILDTSGSMEGDKISSLNHGMEETIAALKEVAKKNGDAKLKVAVMEFNTGARWITSNGPEDLEEDFVYEYLTEGGLTDVGAALTELESKLHQTAFLKSMTGALMPIFIFMTDGYATDEYMPALEKIRKNRWFARGTKIGFALGEDADVTMIANVVGNKEAVIEVTELDKFRKLIKLVAVTSSMLVSQSVNGTDEIDPTKIAGDAKNTVGVNTDPVEVDPTKYKPEEEWPEEDEDDGDW